MVSLSSDNSEFKDLFTRSTDLPSYSSKAPSSSTTKAQSPQPSIYKRGYTPASAIAAAVRDQHNSVTHRSSSTSKTSTSISSKPSSSRKNSDSDKSNERSDGASTPRLSEARESPRPILPEKDKELPPSLQRRSSVAIASGPASESSSSSMRSRMKQPSARPQGRPPSVPLPLLPSSIPPTPPPSSPPSSPLPEPPANISQPSKVQTDVPQKIHVRARAHTISSVNNAPIPLSPPLSLSRTTSPLASASTIVPRASGGTLDIDNASTNELRQALKSRNKEYEELEASILKMTEAHAAQVASLEKKIALLEKEARKRETQIKGFTWLLNDGEAPQQSRSAASGPSAASRFASRAIVAGGSLSDHDGYRTSPLSPRRFAYQSDSGAESHATSGAESHRVSGASGSESTSSMFRKSKLRRLYLTGDTSPPPANSEKPLPEAPYSGKRSSMSSVSPSPSSSTSSLLPPSPSITMSSLSAIPEASDPGGTLRLPRHESSELSDERRAIRHSSYSSNAKRSRPPSIAQVLDKSPNLGDVLEKLRPFS
ncbi:hypothetical protein CPB84DRAFT_1775825 [Gymnopilus junonius]|uniref:Uncharacterized protein n=1 Tax=Gymnopilus junonius TaxID=109634 RepID=A0A9P5NN15_GYMJU|nr:hypothetical protein CPB84DRAFT_1775825 [Gymnopilus junonius]